MMDLSPANPRLTFALIKLQDKLDALAEHPNSEYTDIIAHRDAVLKRFRSTFAVDHLPSLTATEFTDFLLYRNNHHWDSLHRVGPHMVKDMPRLCQTLALLLDESLPIQSRLNTIRPERAWGEHAMVPYLGMAPLTAILLVMHPQKYSVWNNTSQAGMQKVKLWDDRWDSIPAGDAYARINPILLYLAAELNIDLWTLDALWWMIKK